MGRTASRPEGRPALPLGPKLPAAELTAVTLPLSPQGRPLCQRATPASRPGRPSLGAVRGLSSREPGAAAPDVATRRGNGPRTGEGCLRAALTPRPLDGVSKKVTRTDRQTVSNLHSLVQAAPCPRCPVEGAGRLPRDLIPKCVLAASAGAGMREGLEEDRTWSPAEGAGRGGGGVWQGASGSRSWGDNRGAQR